MFRKLMILGVFYLLIFLFGASRNVLAANTLRFDFQLDTGEGTEELYRIEVDQNQKKGEVCLLNTGSSNVPEEKIVSIRKGTLWSKIIDYKKYEHTCLPFELYDPFGWFLTDASVNSEQEMRIAFIGNITKEKISGKIYQFIKIKGSKKQYRTGEEREVSAKSIVVK